MSLQIDHANLVVRDLAAATAFYRDGLGLSVVQEGPLSGAWIEGVIGVGGAEMDCVILAAPGGGARLELLAYRNPPPLTVEHHSQPNALGLRHLAFRVDDLDALAARLVEHGARLLSQPQAVPFPVAGQRKRLVYFLDPECVLLELAEYRPLPNDHAAEGA